MPDAGMAELALDQHRAITELISRTAMLNRVVELELSSIPTSRIESGIENLRLRVANFPPEIVMPVMGYQCLRAIDSDMQPENASLVTIFDPILHKDAAEAALIKAVAFLENSN